MSLPILDLDPNDGDTLVFTWEDVKPDDNVTVSEWFVNLAGEDAADHLDLTNLAHALSQTRVRVAFVDPDTSRGLDYVFTNRATFTSGAVLNRSVVLRVRNG